MLWLGNNDGFVFFGNERNERFKNDINQFIDDVIAPKVKRIGLEWFEAIGNHAKWEKAIETLFAHRKLASWNQRVYMLQKENHQAVNEPVIDKDYSVLKISRALYENKTYSIKNIEFLHSKILEFCPSADSFFHHGMGYCVLYNQQIVSVCFSGFVVENVHGIDIETLEAHQGKKLAQIIASYFVKDCHTNGMIPYWDCMEENHPSVAIAEKIGLSLTFNYVGYEFQFK